MAPYCLGLFVGYTLLKRPLVSLPRHLSIALWLILPPLSVTTLLLTYLWNGAFDEPELINPSPLISGAYVAMHRIIWSSLIAWLVFACATGRARLLSSFLSHYLFVPLSRLSFAVYLTHLPVIMYRALNLKTTVEWTDANMLWEASGNFAVSVAVAYFINVTFESPFINLERAFCSSRHASFQSSSSSSASLSSSTACSSASTTAQTISAPSSYQSSPKIIAKNHFDQEEPRPSAKNKQSADASRRFLELSAAAAAASKESSYQTRFRQTNSPDIQIDESMHQAKRKRQYATLATTTNLASRQKHVHVASLASRMRANQTSNESRTRASKLEDIDDDAVASRPLKYSTLGNKQQAQAATSDRHKRRRHNNNHDQRITLATPQTSNLLNSATSGSEMLDLLCKQKQQIYGKLIPRINSATLTRKPI